MINKKNIKKQYISQIGIGVIVIVAVLMAGISTWHDRSVQLATYKSTLAKITLLEATQKENELQAVDTTRLDTTAATIKQQIDKLDLTASNNNLTALGIEITNDQKTLERAIALKKIQEAEIANNVKAPNNTPPANTLFLPILMYHKPPADFEKQMKALKDKGYTTVHMGEVANYLAGKTTPPAKPAVVTFDDGFEVQKNALSILEKYNQKATLYLIEGGSISHYCIGLLRSNLTCGDSYLSVSDVKQMLSSNIIEIGDHTVDHPNMTALSPDGQKFQITTSKEFLEQTFGLPITTFAYPYGLYNASVVRIVSQSGFTTAVTTQPGVYQPKAQPFLLHRVRTTYDLP
jgi:peptidoglycan/xylan/chitin deacetylase (PgdA/CDA1 family)